MVHPLRLTDFYAPSQEDLKRIAKPLTPLFPLRD